jgi:ABC-type multidrug transport system fused ATPase/permease subunit
MLYFLNLRAAVISAELMASILLKPYDFVKTRPPAEFLYSVNSGIQNLLVNAIGSIGIIFNEIVLLVIVTVAAFIVDPVVSLVSLFYFGFFAIAQGKKLNIMAQKNTYLATQESIYIDKKVMESLYLYREMHIRNARNIGSKDLVRSKLKLAQLNSNIDFLPYIAKYSMEILLVLGAFLMSAIQFLLKDAVSAITTLALFVVASSRISPAILRLQQASIRLKSGIGAADPVLNLLLSLKEFGTRKSSELPQEKFRGEGEDQCLGKVSLKNVDFKYFDGNALALKDINLEILPGQMVAIVGPSGNGKSTLVDLIMGAILPTKGSVLIDGKEPKSFINLYPGSIGYVAQESVFTNTSVKSNLLLGVDESKIDDMEIWNTLSKVGLVDVINSLEKGLNSPIGERGLMLSVGQRQRLSIARALITKPKILLFDEPTSSLDAYSEELISNLINSLKGDSTIIVIAHRLKTIREADLVVVMKNGRIVQSGSSELLKVEE